jgi:hypothetical protein
MLMLNFAPDESKKDYSVYSIFRVLSATTLLPIKVKDYLSTAIVLAHIQNVFAQNVSSTKRFRNRKSPNRTSPITKRLRNKTSP